MFPGLSDLDQPVLTKVLRRTVITALVVGAIGVVVALLFSPLAGVGVAIGLVVAFANLRFLDAGVAKVETKGESDRKVVRRLLGTRTATRLAVITAVAIGLMLLNGPLGIGVVVGLVIFQMVFVANVGRAILATGIQ